MPTRIPMVLPRIRYLVRHDMNEVVRIEEEAFDSPWTRRDFAVTLAMPWCVGMVVEDGVRMVGYLLYRKTRKRAEILTMAIRPRDRRRGLATALIDRVKSLSVLHGRRCVRAIVRERNLGAQLFFQSCGFRVVQQMRGYWREVAEDGYVFEWYPEKMEDR